MMPTLDIVIVNWNAGDQLRECIRSIPAALDGTFHLNRVWVVDNASRDDSLERLDTPGLHVEIIRNQENLGFGRACNQGAALGNADYLLFLNPDTRLYPQSLALPISVLERRENAWVGVCGIQLVDAHGAISRSCSRFITLGSYFARLTGLNRILPGIFKSHDMVEWDHAQDRDVDHVIGAFYLIRRSLFDSLGGFDERFFVYLEDLDLSKRVQSAGKSCRYLASARAFHKGGGTSESVKATRLFYSLRSQIQYAFKHLPRAHAWILLAATCGVEPWIRIAFALVQRSPKSAHETMEAYRRLYRSLAERTDYPELRQRD